MEIIEWCNNNQGFISAILSLLTLIASIIAIIISVEGQVFTNIKTIEESRIMLNPGETTTQYFYNSEFSAFSKIQQNKKAYAYAEDSEGKKYKKYICKVKNLVK